MRGNPALDSREARAGSALPALETVPRNTEMLQKRTSGVISIFAFYVFPWDPVMCELCIFDRFYKHFSFFACFHEIQKRGNLAFPTGFISISCIFGVPRSPQGYLDSNFTFLLLSDSAGGTWYRRKSFSYQKGFFLSKVFYCSSALDRARYMKRYFQINMFSKEYSFQRYFSKSQGTWK